MMRRLSCIDDVLPSNSNMEATSRYSQKSKLDTVKIESGWSPVNQVDFQDLFCVLQSPEMPDESAKYDATDSLSILEIHASCVTSFGADGKLAESLPQNQVETANMTTLFQRIEAIYI